MQPDSSSRPVRVTHGSGFAPLVAALAAIAQWIANAFARGSRVD